LIGLVFLFVLAVTVTEAAQLVGTLLVLSLAITPAAAAQRLSASPTAVALLSVLFAVVSAEGGLLLSFQFPSVKPSVLIVGLSFFFYVAARLVGPPLVARRRQKTLASAGMSPAGPDVPRPRDYPEGPDLAELHHD